MDFNLRKKIYLLLLVVMGAGSFVGYQHYVELKEIEARKATISKVKNIKSSVNSKIFEQNEFPPEIAFGNDVYQLDYTIDNEFNAYIEKLLKRYRTDFSSVVVLDNKTGNIIAAVGYSGKEKKLNKSLAFSTTHPGASLIKIITTANLFESGRVSPYTQFNFKGRGSTLYKYQLADKPPSRWSRFLSFEKAFMYSNNVVFGKAAIKQSNALSLLKTATNFGFNRQLMDDIPVSSSIFNMPKNQYNLAELASGMNRKTMMSPLHAALLSSIIANDGVLKKPALISKISGSEGELPHGEDDFSESVISKETARSIKELMKKTVRRGTARALSRTLKRKVARNVEVGGKTGSITGGIPFGKRDWLTVFAIPEGKAGISIGIMNINIKRWHVRSTHLAKNIIEYYYKKINKPMEQQFAALEKVGVVKQ
jgi:cell division protein FtsI/penicillin-binding protein 2